eukprot:Opistho-2@79276
MSCPFFSASSGARPSGAPPPNHPAFPPGHPEQSGGSGDNSPYTNPHHLGDALITFDEFGHVVALNNTAERLLGVASSLAIGAPIGNFIPFFDYRGAFAPNRKRAADDGEENSEIAARLSYQHISGGLLAPGTAVEMDAKTADGRIFPAEVCLLRRSGTSRSPSSGSTLTASANAMQVDDMHGIGGDSYAHPLGERHVRTASVIVRDARSRVRSETLVESQVLQSVLDLAADAIITITSEGIVHSFNNAAEKMFGYSASEVINNNVKMLMPSPYAENHDMYLRNYVETGVRRVIGIGREVEGRRKDGSVFPMELSLSEVKYGECHLFTGIIRDITERKTMQRTLIYKRQKLQAVLDLAIDAILTIGIDGIVLSLNSAAEKMFGYEPFEVIGHNVNMLMPPPYAENHDSYLRRYLETGEKQIIGIGREVIGLRKDGTQFPMELAVSEVKAETYHFFTGFCRDITERKAHERRLMEETRKLTGVFESCLDGIIIIGSDGTVQSLNDAAVRMFGYTRADVVGRNVKMLMPADYAEHHDSYLQRYLETGQKRVGFSSVYV